jgi:hypothetical protein
LILAQRDPVVIEDVVVLLGRRLKKAGWFPVSINLHIVGLQVFSGRDPGRFFDMQPEEI